jgi:transcriptional regulator with XRE-family HTH domain
LSLPTFDTLERLADALNTPVREFFDIDTVDPTETRSPSGGLENFGVGLEP